MRTRGFGYLPDLPSIKDLTIDSKEVLSERLKYLDEPPVKRMLRQVGVEKPLRGLDEIGETSDVSQWCSPIEDQGSIGSCVANAKASLIEYFQNRAFGRYEDMSRLFIYKMARRLSGLTGDSGAYSRCGIEAIVMIGAPTEEHWPYNVAEFDKEPEVFHYQIASNYKAISYYRLDPIGVSRDDVIIRIKTNLIAGLPCSFGFTVYSSYVQADTNGGKIPFPTRRDRVVGGHEVVIVGHNDLMEVRNVASGTPTVGAFKIRNSWGTDWGDKGYGWLPYDYVRYGLADDFWSVLQASWVDSGQFSL